MNRLTIYLFATLALASARLSLAQNPPPVPSNYQDLYNTLENDLNGFNTTLSGLWSGSTYPVIFGGNLANSNGNTGPSLGTGGGGFALELQALKAAGVQGVVVQAGFPILYQPFYSYLSTQSGYQNLQYSQFVTYYQNVAQAVHAAGLKLIVENDVLLSNDVAAGWSPVIGNYYATLNWSQFVAARAQCALATAQTMNPDDLVVLEQPDSQAQQTNQPNINTVSGAATLLNAMLTSLSSVRSSFKVGAGMGTALQNFQAFAQSFSGVNCSSSQPCVNSPGLDFVDMHVYPINNLGGNQNFLQNALTIASIAQSGGKPVAITEAWAWKVRDNEYGTMSSDAIRGRDPFSFWSPVDSYFIQTMENLANYTQMLFMAVEGPDYLWAYQPYNSTTSSETPSQILNAETTLANQANQVAAYTSTALSYYKSLVLPPDTTPPTAPANLKATSGSATTASMSWTASTDNVGVAGYYIFRNGTQIYTTAFTSYQDSALAPTTAYTYTIEAFDLGGNVSSPATVTVTTKPDTTPPSVPTNLAATLSGSQASLTWTASTDNVGVASYYVYRNGTQIASTPNTSYQDTGLSPSTTYTYTVAAYDAAGNVSAQSSPASVTTPADTTPPTVPANVTAQVSSATQINLSWTASSDPDSPVAGYNVYRNGTKITSVTSTTYQDTGLTPATTYSYAVSAYDPSGNVSAQSAAVSVATQPDTSAPTVPAGLAAQAVSATQINLSWGASTDPDSPVAGYNVYRNGSKIGTAAAATYQDTGLTPSTTYSYTVSAYDPAGNTSAQSSAVSASTQPDTTPPSVPAGLAAQPVSPNQINLSWSASTDPDSPVTGYNIYRNGAKVGTAAGTTYQDTSLTASTTYSYTVSAYDPAGNTSAQSTAVSAATLPDTTPPSVPAGVTAQAVSPIQINLSWTPSTDPDSPVSGYYVYRNGAKAGATTGTTYQDTGLSPSTTYTYSLSAYDPAGNTSAQSSPVTATTQPDTTPPTVPTNLTTQSVSATQINLSWTASTDPDSPVSGYNIYRNGTKIAATAGSAYQDTGLTPSTTYSYTVSAYDPANNTSAQSAPASAKTQPDTTPPSVPTNLAGSASSSKQINLTWSASTDADSPVAGYNVYRNGTLVGAVPGTSYSDTGLSANTTYTYTVSAYDPAGNTSAQSAPISVTTLKKLHLP